MKQFMPKPNSAPIIITAQDVIGDRIDDWALSALATAISQECRVQFTFGGILMNVMPDMWITEIVANYNKKAEYQHHLHMNFGQGMKDQTKAKLKALKHEHKNEKVLATIATEKFRISYPYAYRNWKNNSGEFGAVFRYAENWAKLMQAECKSGKKLTRKLILRTGADANIDGLTDSMAAMARGILTACWTRGRKFGILLGNDVEEIRNNRWKCCVQNARLSRVK